MTATPDGSPRGARLSVNVASAGPWVTVELCGELDVATAPALLDRVGLLIAQETPPRIALQLSQVSFCDSSGVNAFIRLWKRVSAVGGELVVLRPRPRLAELLARIGLDRYLRVVDAPPDVSGGETTAELG
ncbi:STAS domain-containing protein [Actinomadura sp. NPDC023710]|uniref:STAS domain-containing protein n=1 Tax=Actinomadura sp. NPDC023710 TaxID=3158219 RepID=UPI0033E0106C